MSTTNNSYKSQRDVFLAGLKSRNLILEQSTLQEAAKTGKTIKPKGLKNKSIESVEAKRKVVRASRTNQVTGLPSGWSSDKQLTADYLKSWRKKNPEKQKEYRIERKKDPVKREAMLKYDRNRPNKEDRLEANRIKYHLNMQDPLFVKKEKLRSKLRRNLRPLEKELVEKQYSLAVKAWKDSKHV